MLGITKVYEQRLKWYISVYESKNFQVHYFLNSGLNIMIKRGYEQRLSSLQYLQGNKINIKR